MMRISQKIALNEKCEALITGESLGQVASQTLQAIHCTDSVVSIPVFRPLIGMDKEEIVSISKKLKRMIYQFNHLKTAAQFLCLNTQEPNLN